MNLAAKVLHDNAEDREWQEGEECQLWADTEHKRQRSRREDNRVCGVHDARADEHAYGIQVVGDPRHDVAGAGLLVIPVRKSLEMREKVVAQIKLDFARNANQNPSREVLEDRLYGSDGQQVERILEQSMYSDLGVQVADGVTNHHGKENPHGVVAQHAQRTDAKSSAVLPEIWSQWT